MQGMQYWDCELGSHNMWSLKSSQTYNWKENLSLFIQANKDQSSLFCFTISKEVKQPANRKLHNNQLLGQKFPDSGVFIAS